MSLTITYRYLPHWRHDGAIYFITWSLASGQADLTPEERTVVENALRFFEGDRYDLFAWVVMNDHVHLVVRPLGAWRLDSLIHTWKSFTANVLRKRGRNGRVWLPEAYDRIVRDHADLLQKATYVVSNPNRRWPGVEGYRWVGRGMGWEAIGAEGVRVLPGAGSALAAP